MDLEFIESRKWGDGRFPIGTSWENNLGESLIGFGLKYGIVDCESDNSRRLRKYPFLPGDLTVNDTSKLNRIEYAMGLVSTEITERIRGLISEAIQNPTWTQRRVDPDIDYLEKEMLGSATLELDELLLLNEMSTAAIQGRLNTFVTPGKVEKINRLIRRFGLQGLKTLHATGGPPQYDVRPCYLVLNAYSIMTEVDKKGEFRRIHLPDRSMTSRAVLGALRPDSRFKIDESAAETVHGSFGKFLNHMGGLPGEFFPIYMERPTIEHFKQTGGFFLAPEGALVRPDMKSFIPFSNTLYRSVYLDAPHRIDADFGFARYRDSGVTSTEWHRAWWKVRGNSL